MGRARVQPLATAPTERGLSAFAALCAIEALLLLVGGAQSAGWLGPSGLGALAAFFVALVAAKPFALWSASRLDPALGARGSFRIATVAGAATLVLALVVPVFRAFGGGLDAMTRVRCSIAFGAGFSLAEVVLFVAIGFGLLAIGRATRQRSMRLWIGATWAFGAVLFVGQVFTWERAQPALALLFLVISVAASSALAFASGSGARALARLERKTSGASPYRAAASADAPHDDPRLPVAWNEPAAGITLFLGGAAAHAAASALGFAVTSGLDRADDAAMRQAQESALFVAILGGAALFAMLVGVYRLARAPKSSGAVTAARRAFAALALAGVIGVSATSSSLDALGANPSNAVDASLRAHVLWLAALPFGVAAIGCLADAIALLARSQALPLAEKRARRVAPLVTVATAVLLGAAVGDGVSSVMLPSVLVAAPLALVALVSFVGAALELRGTIKERLDADAPSSVGVTAR